MSKQITVNGKIFEPSAVLARRFGYSIDYVSRLAREEKIEATRVGRQWYAEAVSLKHFVDEAAAKKEKSREQLSVERKREHKTHTGSAPERTAASDTQAHANHAVSTPTYAATATESVATVSTSQSEGARVATALIGSFLVLVAGGLVGVGLNPGDFHALTQVHPNQLTVPAPTAGNTTAGAWGAKPVPQSDEMPTVPVPSQPAVAPGVADTGIVVFEEVMSEERLREVRSAFSDEVEVTFESEDSGVITPVFRDGRGDDYQFLMVPVQDSS